MAHSVPNRQKPVWKPTRKPLPPPQKPHSNPNRKKPDFPKPPAK